MGDLLFEGHRIEYDSYGEGDRTVVLVHGLLMNRRMFANLAPALAERGNRVITVDLLGHGRSDRPEDLRLYSMPLFARQLLALLDDLEIDSAVFGGTSLGANVALEVAVMAPERVRGILAEMPVLDNALEAGILAFAPLLFVSRFLPLAVRTLRSVTRPVPRGLVPFWVGIALDTCDQRPRPMAAAIHGIFFGRIAPPSRLRRRITAPALVVGHPRDPVHPAADAAMLAEELPASRFVEAHGILEWRLRPARLDQLSAEFVAECFADDARGAGRLPG